MYICRVSVLVFLFACCTSVYSSGCGVNPTGLASWTALYGTTVANDITITQPVLVDAVSINAQAIILSEGGQLYFDVTKSISLAANYILINSGAGLYIGSEECPYTQKAIITLQGSNPSVNADFGGNFIGVASGGVLELHGLKALGQSWTKLAASASVGANTIEVVTSLNGLQAGDKIVIATTDFDPTLNDVVTVTTVTGTTISFTPPLQYPHYGEITNNVDERAEVGSLTRNILIQGVQQAQYFGGHLMAMRGFSAVHIEGVEFNNMGQDQIARYPVHFHLCDDVPAGTYVKYNSIHDTNFRCVTVHASNGVLVEGNVAYNNLGHCYFLEDGVEMNNVFRGNLAILTQPKDFGQHIGSDMTGTGLSSYWITNPNNTFEDNAAVGSFVAGYWIETRIGARGLSACIPEYQNLPYVIANLPLQSFTNNSAHSCSFGLGIESTDWDAGDSPAQTCDTPVANWEPLNPDGSIPWTYFVDFTAHHIGQRGLWARMPNIVLEAGRFADNYEAVEYATSGDMPPYASQQIIQDTIIVGFSDNKGSQAGNAQYQAWDTTLQQSVPEMGVGNPINGIKIYDGPQVIINTVFVNFPNVSTRPNAPIGARTADQSQVATTNYVQNVQFVNSASRFNVIDNGMDGGITCNFRDTDGSVSGYANSTALRNFDYYSTPECIANDVFMLVCPHKYAQMWVMDMTANGANNEMTIIRSDHVGTDHSDYSLEFTGFSSGPVWRYQPIVSIQSSYLVYFQDHVPSSLVLQLNNAEIGDSVGVAICYPLGTVITSVQRGLANYYGNAYPTIQSQSDVSSLSSNLLLSSSTGDSYYWNEALGVLYINLQQRYARTEYGNFCPDEGCDWVWINAQFTGSAAAPDCSLAAYAAGFQRPASTWLSQTLTPAKSTPSGVLQNILSGVFPQAAPASAPPRAAAISTSTGSTVTAPPPITAATTAPTTAAPPTEATTAATTDVPPTAATTAATTSECSTTCPSTLSCCGNACYEASQYVCSNGNLCALGMLSCGMACYPPSQFSCDGTSLVPL